MRAVLPALALLFTAPAMADEETAKFFQQNCASCHTVGGGRLTGPDLKDVGRRRDAAWLKRFIADPKALVDGGDPTARELLQEYRGVLMPTVQGMNPARAEALVRLLEEESALPKSRFAGSSSSVPERPFTREEILAGRDLFLGVRPLRNGGPACVACHSVQDLGSLGGGRLGPDLTGAFVRLEGRKGLAGWLASPPSPVMQPVFRACPLDAAPPADPKALDEVSLLVAYLERASQEPPAAEGPQLFFLVFAGLAGAALCLVGFDFAWGRRFRGVRRPLVRDAKERSPR